MTRQPTPGGQERTVVTRRGYGQRLKGAISGVIAGLALIAAATALLWWNEGRAVKTATGLVEGTAEVVSVASDMVDPANNGRLVHVLGQAESLDSVRDPLLGVEEPAIALIREVEMYQWKQRTRTESRTRLGGSEEQITTYSYHPEWSASQIDSSRFHDPAHHNPAEMPVPAFTSRAANVALGEFRLNEALIAQIGASHPYPLHAEHAQRLPERLRRQVDDEQPDWLYLGDAQMPEVGDLRLRLRVVRDQPVSLIARQIDNTFEPYTTRRGTTIQRLSGGTLSAETMFSRMEHENTLLSWGLRLLGVMMMIGGFGLMLKPIEVVFDVLPFLGALVGLGTGLIAALSGLILSLIVIAVAWLVYRPTLSVMLIGLSAGLIFWLFRRARNSAQNPA